MRIVHVTDVYLPCVGGIELFVADLARQQVAAGHDVTVLTRTPAGDVPEVPGPVTVLRVDPGVSLRGWSGGGLLRPDEVDAVHVHLSVYSPFSSLVGRAAVAAGLPTVLTVHSMWSGRGAIIRIVGGIAGWNRWRAVWTGVSEAAARDMRSTLAPGTAVGVVCNAIDVEWWREPVPLPRPAPPVDGTDPAPVSEPAPNGVTLLTVMRLVPRKRPLPLLRILRDLRSRVPADVPLRCVIIGEGRDRARVEREIAALGLGDWVTLTGGLSRTEVREWCRRADVYVAPAFKESFGIAALEARAAGLPVVAMRGCGVDEFVRSGIEGLLCNDDRDVARGLARLVNEPDLRATIARHNTATAPAMTWSRTVGGFDLCYEQAAVVAAHGRAPAHTGARRSLPASGRRSS